MKDLVYHVVKDFLNPTECARLQNEWTDALTTEETVEAAKQFSGRVVRLRQLIGAESKAVSTMLIAARRAWAVLAYQIDAVAEMRPDDIQLVRWRKGDKHAPHMDATPQHTPWRKYAAVIYLNEDFAGGKLFFPDHDAWLVPHAGSLVLMGPVLHGVTEVTRGTRYTCVMWFTDDRSRMLPDEVWRAYAT